MNNIMKLADVYAQLTLDGYVEANSDYHTPARAALEAAVEQLEKDAKRYHTVLGMSSDQMLRLYNTRIDLREQFIDKAMEAK